MYETGRIPCRNGLFFVVVHKERRSKKKEPFYGFLHEGGFMKKFFIIIR